MEIKVSKEIRGYKERVFFGLSTRQFICAAGSVGMAAGVYFLLKDSLNQEAISWLCLASAAPVAAAGFGKTAEEMAGIYGFTRDQRQMLNELLTDYRALLTGLASDLTIPGGDASDVVDALPEELDPARRAAVEKALSLVGKVGYFWGGKSYKMGWDDRWGTLQQVTASGSSTSGTWIPFGLDCSGFLDWSFRNAGLFSAGHWYLETNLNETTWDEVQPGDVALFPDDSHVGLVVGRDGSGRVLVVHCSYSLNIVAVSDARAFGFTKVGTPEING